MFSILSGVVIMMTITVIAKYYFCFLTTTVGWVNFTKRRYYCLS